MNIKGFPLKREPRYGAYLWWPEEGKDWIHPNDAPIAEDYIPGSLVFCRTDLDEDFSIIRHGEIEIRVRPTLWYPIKYENYDVNDFVEVCSMCGQNQPLIATIAAMRWNSNAKIIEYSLVKAGKEIPRVFHAGDLQPAERLSRLPVHREKQLRVIPPKD